VLLDVGAKEHWSLEDRVQALAANIEGKTLESEKGRRHLELAAVSQKISVLLSALGSYNAVLRYLIA
ncbi:unnamed protein product, partial [Porites lobata]